jgi:hypothetical protein
MKLEFSRQFREKLKYNILPKSVQWQPTCSMRTDRQTDIETGGRKDVTKLIVAFRNSANAPKIKVKSCDLNEMNEAWNI